MSDADALLTALEAQIATHQREIAAHAAAIEQVRRMHRDDLTRIGNELILLIAGYGEPDDYDTFATRMNELLTHPLPIRERTFRVKKIYRVEVHATISATDEDNALAAIGDCWFDPSGNYGWDVAECDLIEAEGEEQ